MIPVFNSTNSTPFSYQGCLIPNLPEGVQHHVRNITDHVVRPLNMLLAALSFALNALVFITVARIKSLQHPSLLMLCSLGMTDIIFAQYSLFRDIQTFAHEHMCPSVSPEKNVLPILSQATTLGNLAVISRDRFLAVAKPWWYRNHMTRSRAMKLICVPWVISVVVSLVVYVSHKLEGEVKTFGRIVVSVFYVICFFIILFSNSGILASIIRHRHTLPEEGQQLRAIIEREKRLACTVGFILLILLFTFLPGYLMVVILFAKGLPIDTFSPFFSCLFLLNGILNPLINFGRNKNMRNAVSAALKCRCSPEVQPSNVTVERNANNELHVECSPEVQPSNVTVERHANNELHVVCPPEVQPSNVTVERDANNEHHVECSPKVQPSNVAVERNAINNELHDLCSPEVQPS